MEEVRCLAEGTLLVLKTPDRPTTAAAPPTKAIVVVATISAELVPCRRVKLNREKQEAPSGNVRHRILFS